MTDQLSPQEKFAQEQARQAISQRYVEPETLDPTLQDRIDGNRIPGSTMDGSRFAISDAVRDAPPQRGGLTAAIRSNPTQSVLIAAAIGFVAAIIVR